MEPVVAAQESVTFILTTGLSCGFSLRSPGSFLLGFTMGCVKVLFIALCIGCFTWLGLPFPAQASLHTYREQPGQVTVRSRLSLRDVHDRAWQAIAFKRTQGSTLQGIYLRLVGFPSAAVVDRDRPAIVYAPTGQQWQLPGSIDPQTQSLPENVGQYDLQPLLQDISRALPLEMQLPLIGDASAEFAIAPFVVAEWLQVKASTDSPAPMPPPLGKEA